VTTVLTLDYSGFDDRARVSTLLAGHPDLTVVPLMTRNPPNSLSASEYASALLEESPPSRPIRAVVAYCLTAPIAHEVVRLVSPSGCRPPVLIILDGAPCTAEAVRENYRASLARFADDDISPRVQPTDLDLAERPEHVLAAMSDELTAMAVQVLAAEVGSGPGADEVLRSIAGELVRSAMSWLTSLVAAHNATFPEWPGKVVSIVSEGHPFSASWPGASDVAVRTVACARAELLAHPDTHRLVMATLDGGS
jgi:hypothetical protein